MPRVLPNRHEVLNSARRVADFALTQRVPNSICLQRNTYGHVGALFADAVLQAGLSYRSVVVPRVWRILKEFPNADCVSALVNFVNEGSTTHLLNWRHPTKLKRFELLVGFFYKAEVDTIEEIAIALRSKKCSADLQLLNGIGPKTVDYMSCLVGIDTIAVDRHIKAFALRAGIYHTDYYFLKNTFCFAADLLSISRREFDAWVWTRESRKSLLQLDLVF